MDVRNTEKEILRQADFHGRTACCALIVLFVVPLPHLFVVFFHPDLLNSVIFLNSLWLYHSIGVQKGFQKVWKIPVCLRDLVTQREFWIRSFAVRATVSAVDGACFPAFFARPISGHWRFRSGWAEVTGQNQSGTSSRQLHGSPKRDAWKSHFRCPPRICWCLLSPSTNEIREGTLKASSIVTFPGVQKPLSYAPSSPPH